MSLLFCLCVFFVIPFFALFLCFYLILFLVSSIVCYKCDCSCSTISIHALFTKKTTRTKYRTRGMACDALGRFTNMLKYVCLLKCMTEQI